MAKHQWSILCRKSIIDKDANAISLIDTLEGLEFVAQNSQDLTDKTKSNFGRLTDFQMVSLWIRSDRTKSEGDTARIQVKSPNGKILISQEYAINLNKSVRTRQTINFQGVPYTGPGAYSYITQQQKGSKSKPRWTTVSELYLDLSEKKSEESPSSKEK